MDTLGTKTIIGADGHPGQSLPPLIGAPTSGVLSKRREQREVIFIFRYINSHQLRYPLIAVSVLSLFAAVYSDANRLAIEPLVEIAAMILIITTAAVWRR